MSPNPNPIPLKTTAEPAKTFNAMADKAVSETVAATKQTFEHATEVRDNVPDAAQDRMATATNAVSDYWMTFQAMTKEQTGAATDFMSHIMAVKTFPELVQLTTKHAETQLGIYQAHAGELMKSSQAMMAGAMKPIQM